MSARSALLHSKRNLGTSMRALFYALNTFAKRYIASTSEIDETEPARIA
jgi:hypothetical protein